MQKLLRSPVLHFIVIGVLLYFVYEALKPQDKESIAVTSQTIDAIVQQQAELQQLPVSEEQRQQLVRSHIEDEVLLKVAYSRGLDKNDFRVRRRILSLVRSSLTEVVPEPTYTQLQAYFRDNLHEYISDTSWSFLQVYFNFNSEKLPENPKKFIEKISTMKNVDGLGDFSGVGGPRTQVSFDQMAMSYGKQFAENVVNAPQNNWIGPVESTIGIHFVNIHTKHNPEVPSFEQMENYLRQDYIFKKTRELQQNKVLELAKQFEIVVEGEQLEL